MLKNGNSIADRDAKKKTIRDDNFECNGGKLLQSRRSGAQLTLYSAEDMESITNVYRSVFPKLGSCCRSFFRGTLPGAISEASGKAQDGKGGFNKEAASTSNPPASGEEKKKETAGGREVLVVEVERVPRPQLEQFVDQLIFLSRVPQEKNVVRVIGCCLEKLTPLIVYEFHGEEARPLSECTPGEGAGPSPVRAAINVARGLAYLSSQKWAAISVARGLAYLSSQKYSRSKFVHGDICTATILVDASYSADIFYAVGSNLIPRVGNENDVYRDPVRPGTKLSTKSDVYSFGVVLVELLLAGGRTALLNEYVISAKAGRLRDNPQNVMTSERRVEGIKRDVIAMAEMCLNVESPSKRPSMKKVEEKLSKLLTPILN